jgi:hypothetical protein
VSAAEYHRVAQELAILTCLDQVNQGQGQLEGLPGDVGREYAHL